MNTPPTLSARGTALPVRGGTDALGPPAQAMSERQRADQPTLRLRPARERASAPWAEHPVKPSERSEGVR